MQTYDSIIGYIPYVYVTSSFVTGSLYLLIPFTYFTHPSLPTSDNRQSVLWLYKLIFFVVFKKFHIKLKFSLSLSDLCIT